MTFSLRKDQNGYRPVFLLGNLRGECPYGCKFCSVRTQNRSTEDDTIALFDRLYTEIASRIDGPFHPQIFNRGNVTNPDEFSLKLLDHVLDRFDSDPRISYVSINSRERFATTDLLKYLAAKRLSYPVHFIFGLESFSKRMPAVLGKDTRGELKRFVDKLKPFNERAKIGDADRAYTFGLDVNLVFLPELYLPDGERRRGNASSIANGLQTDLRQLLDAIDPDVPVEINIHPYTRVDALPYDNANLADLMAVLPTLQELVEENKRRFHRAYPHFFVGIEGDGYSGADVKAMLDKFGSNIDCFNHTGRW